MHPLLFLVIMCCLFCGGSLGQAGQALAAEPVAVFTASTSNAPAPSRTQPAATVLQERRVGVNLPALFPAGQQQALAAPDAAPLKFNLFDNRTIQVAPLRWEPTADGAGLVFVGKNDDTAGGETRIANTNGTLYGLIRTGGALFYEIAPDGAGGYSIKEMDQRTFPDEKDAIVPTPPASKNAVVPGASKDDGAVIDIMVVYTTSAKNAVGGAAAMASLISLAISETNQGYTNSGMVQRFRLVHTAEVNYDESSGFDDALSRLASTSDGYMDEVHTLRDQYGADIVSLIINNGEYCGLGYMMRSLAWDFAPYAFNVVHYSCATGYYSLAHECGHNQAADHNRANSSSAPLYTYAYGYQQLSASPPFRTVMAYNCPDGCTRVNYWSNPNVSYSGYPTGIVSTAADAADNHLTLNNTRTTAANWRQAVTPPTPSTAGGVPPMLYILGN